jgi:hypothetical protein
MHDVVGWVVPAFVIVAALVFRFAKNGWAWDKTKKRPLFWASTYLTLMIIVFPLIYVFDSDGFAQTTGTQEDNFAGRLKTASDTLTSAVNDAIKQQAAGNSANFGYASVVVQDADAYRITGTIVYADTAENVLNSDLQSPIEIRESDVSSARDHNPGGGTITLAYSGTGRYRAPAPSNPANPSAALAQQLFAQYSSPANHPKLNIPADKFSDVEALERVATGRVGASGGFWSNLARMVYFSAVTATTLGYGDIVPVETSTRVMVTTEAVLGVVTVGLFLNALAKGIESEEEGGDQNV